MAPSIASPSREEEFQWAGNAVRPSGFRYSFSCLSAFPHNESPRRLVILLSEEISPALNSHFPTQLCQSSQRPIRIVMIFIQCACAARTMIKCSNGSDMCPKRHVVNGHLVSRRGGRVPYPSARRLPGAGGPSLRPSLQSVLSRRQIADDNGRVRQRERRRLTCRLPCFIIRDF